METIKQHRRFTKEEISNHCSTYSCWVIIRDKVYDVTPFIREHPGGMDVLLENAGIDATASFEASGHSADARSLMRKYYIGDVDEKD